MAHAESKAAATLWLVANEIERKVTARLDELESSWASLVRTHDTKSSGAA